MQISFKWLRNLLYNRVTITKLKHKQPINVLYFLFLIDKNEILFVVLAILLIFSIAVWGFLCWATFIRKVEGTITLDDDEMRLLQSRILIHQIRQRRRRDTSE